MLAAALPLTGCGGLSKAPPPAPAAPKPPKPLALALSVAAAQQLNPDARGRASPVVLRIYELKAMAQFNTADFLTLFERDRDALGDDLVSREEWVIRPGETKASDKVMNPEARFVGVMAAFRDIERAQWRASLALAAGKDNAVAITLGELSVRALQAAR